MTDYLGPYLLGYNDTLECGIYTGDARELAKAIPDESVDLIFTDPVYQNIDDYRWLAETAARVLRPNSVALIWCGIGFLPETLQALIAGGLRFKWQMAALRPTGVPSRYAMNKVFSNWRSMLWLEKGKSVPVETISDVLFSKDGSNNIHHGKWDKSFSVVFSWLYRFTGDFYTVFDPFSGGGVVPVGCKLLGRRYLAFEIEPETADRARARVRQTQPPLFVPEAEQEVMRL